MQKLKPMKALKFNQDKIDTLVYPVIASPKVNGVRCLVIDGEVVTDKLVPITNRFIIDQILRVVDTMPELEFDGMIIDKDIEATSEDIKSAMMNENVTPDFVYMVFDCIGGNPFYKRLALLDKELPPSDRIKLVPYEHIFNKEQLIQFETKCLTDGAEGAMIRSMDGPYKYGEPTEKEGYLLKMKRFFESEAVIHGFMEKNSNDKNKRGSSTLGSLVVQLPEGITFTIKEGFTDKQRKEIWDNRQNLQYKSVRFKYPRLNEYRVPEDAVFMSLKKDY